MEIAYANSKIRKICTDDKAARKEYGKDIALTLRERLNQIADAENLDELRNEAGHWHELKGNRKGQLACSLSGRLRLIFVPAHVPIPSKPDGGLEWKDVTAVMNIEIVNYHES